MASNALQIAGNFLLDHQEAPARCYHRVMLSVDLFIETNSFGTLEDLQNALPRKRAMFILLRVKLENQQCLFLIKWTGPRISVADRIKLQQTRSNITILLEHFSNLCVIDSSSDDFVTEARLKSRYADIMNRAQRHSLSSEEKTGFSSNTNSPVFGSLQVHRRAYSIHSDLDITDENVLTAYQDVDSHANPIDWALFVYQVVDPSLDPTRQHKLQLLDKGTGGVAVLRDKIPQNRVSYGLLQIVIGHMTKRKKLVFIVSPGAPEMTTNFQRIFIIHKNVINSAFKGISLEMSIHLPSDLQFRIIEQRLRSHIECDEMLLRIVLGSQSEDELSSTPISIYVDIDSSLLDLKEQILEQIGVAISSQRIVRVRASLSSQYGADTASIVVLEGDRKKLVDFNIASGDKLYLEEITVAAQGSLSIASRFIEKRKTVAAERLHELERGIQMHEMSFMARSRSLCEDDRNSELDWEINPDEIFVIEVAGRGRTAVVHHAIWRMAEVALKRFQYITLSDKIRDDFKKEMVTLRTLRHKNIVRFVGACTDPDAGLSLVTEWVPRGSLHSMLRDPDSHVGYADILKMSLDAAEGCQYLHQRGIIHRDLKGQNLLVDEDWVVKLADFGLARHLSSDESNAYTECGTSGWVAPEVLNGDGYAKSADLFSFGMTLWEMVAPGQSNSLCGMAPIPYYNKIQAGMMPVIPDSVPKEFALLIQDCWAFDPEKRPSFDLVVRRLREMLREESKR